MKLFSLQIRTLALALLVAVSGTLVVSAPAYAAGKKNAKTAKTNQKNTQNKKRKQKQEEAVEEEAPAKKRGGGKKNQPKPPKEDGAQQPDAHVKKAKQLFKRFVDTGNKMSWKCFSKQLAATLAAEPKYKPLVTELKTLGSATNPAVIGFKLKKHENLLTQEIKGQMGKYTEKQILDILRIRIALNGKDQC